MSDEIVITAIVCVTLVTIICIFAILAYLKEKASLKIREAEISITTDDDKKSQKK